jgi:hypothetical protein
MGTDHVELDGTSVQEEVDLTVRIAFICTLALVVSLSLHFL